MYKLKYGTAYCLRFSRQIKISYIHIIEKDHLVNDGHICAEAKIHHTCLERENCMEMDCSQNNFFGKQFLQNE